MARNRILVYSSQDCSCLRYVFGISSFSKAIEIEQDMKKMEKTALNLYKNGSFRISAQRIEKDYKYNSGQINKIVGARIVKEKKAKVSLEYPDTNIGIELFNSKAYLFNKKIHGLDGLPVGVEGNVALLLEDKNSILSAILMLKRGCSVTLIEKKKVDTKLLKKFCYGFSLESSKKIPKNAKAMAVNDTIDNIKNRKSNLAIFRPLIGYDAEKLEKWLESI